MNELALFAGAGGGILGGKLLGWRTVCAVEIEPYPISVLLQRQNDGILPPFPIWDDICTFDGKLWRGIVDVISGGFPCQDISAAGKGAGITGSRSGLWSEMARIIGEVRPRFVFVENSPMLVIRGLDRVLGDLATMGYDAEWGIVSAADAGAPHKRDRIWILAYSVLAGERWNKRKSKIEKDVALAYSCKAGLQEESPKLKTTGTSGSGGNVSESQNKGFMWGKRSQGNVNKQIGDRRWRKNVQWWESEPDVGRMVDGVAARVDRLKAIGNGQVSSVVRLAWEILNNKER